jgi:hypothetical protein
MDVSNSLIQVIVALIIIFILYIITIYTLNIPSIIQNTNDIVKPKQTKLIINGYAPISYLNNRRWNTSNYLTSNFIPIPKSVNTMGGSQFTYQFWLKIDNANDDYFKDLILFLKGETQKYKLGLYDTTTSNKVSTIPSDSSGVYAITSPLVKFTDSYRSMQVTFNTLKNPLTTVNIKMNPNDNILSRRNILSLLPLNWYMLTFSFEDNFSTYLSAENGINFKFWINDVLYQENTPVDTPLFKNNTIYQNEGDLVLFPGINKGSDFLQIGNFTYYNWALTQNDISKSFNKGPPKKSYLEKDNLKKTPPILSSFNKIDMYNY